MGNLIANSRSFIWEDKDIDRNHFIRNLNDVLLKISEFDDKIHTSKSLYNSPIIEETFLLDLSQNDFEGFRNIYKWIKQSEYDLLTRMNPYFKYNSETLDDINQINNHFNNALSSWMGFFFVIPDFLVWDENHWYLFHQNYVSSFTRIQRIENRAYFNNFYLPKLNETRNEINTKIARNQINPIFDRLDNPPLNIDGKVVHNQRIHIHFDHPSNSALNIDGTWKHGGFNIPNDALDTLVELGFKLPENL
mgnify:CR=1 FL=1